MTVRTLLGSAALAAPLFYFLAAAVTANSIQFTDATAAAGIKFRHNSGAVG